MCSTGGDPDDSNQLRPLSGGHTTPSTDQIDRREKFEAYTRLPSLQTYVLVHQAQRLLEVYTRSGQGWMMATLSEGTLEVGCAGASVSLEQIYDRIELDG